MGKRNPPLVNKPADNQNVRFPVPVGSLDAQDRAYMYFVSTLHPAWPFQILSGDAQAINDAINTGAREGGYTYRLKDALQYTGVLKGAPLP